MLVTLEREPRAGRFVEVRDVVVARNLTCTVLRAARQRLLPQPAAFIDFEHVNRQMLGPQPRNLRHRFFPRLARLMRQSRNQVQGYVAEPGFAKQCDACKNVGAPMHPPARLQFRIAERLRA